jgi:hypothetical protein
LFAALLLSVSSACAAQGDPAPAATIPYVVIPAGRPWESTEFAREALRFRIPTGGEPPAGAKSLTAKEAGLTRLERGSVLLFHSPGRAQLAAQVADLVERQHRLLAYITRQEFQVLPIAVVGAGEELPQPFGFWVQLDGTTCWTLRTLETELPLRSSKGFWAKVGKSWLYHGTLHECCHHGTCFALGLKPYRWFCEGLSDYVAAIAAVCYSGEGDAAHVREWIEAIEPQVAERESIDLLDDGVWFAPGGGRANNALETAAYGASLYSVARLVHEHGFDWIPKLLADVAQDPATSHASLVAKIERHSGARKLEPRLRAVPLAEVLAYLRGGLEARPPVEPPAPGKK